jgi:hypothetical protein
VAVPLSGEGRSRKRKCQRKYPKMNSIQ